MFTTIYYHFKRCPDCPVNSPIIQFWQRIWENFHHSIDFVSECEWISFDICVMDGLDILIVSHRYSISTRCTSRKTRMGCRPELLFAEKAIWFTDSEHLATNGVAFPVQVPSSLQTKSKSTHKLKHIERKTVSKIATQCTPKPQPMIGRKMS